MPRRSAMRQQHDRLQARAYANQGTARYANPIDPEEYPRLPGLEGPFRFRKSGAILYYDPRAGKYYDSKADHYVDSRLAEALTVGTLQQARHRAGGGPFRAPHFTAPARAMTQEVELAEGGVLYLLDLPDFPKRSIEMVAYALRGANVELVVSPRPDHPRLAERWDKLMTLLRSVSEKFMGTIGPGGKVTKPKKKRPGLVPVSQGAKAEVERQKKAREKKKGRLAASLELTGAPGELADSVKGKPQHGRTSKQTSKATGKAAGEPERDRRNKGRGSRTQAGGGRKYRKSGSSSERGHAKSQRKEPVSEGVLIERQIVRAEKLAAQFRWDSSEWQGALNTIRILLRGGNKRGALGVVEKTLKLVRGQQEDADTFIVQLERIANMLGESLELAGPPGHLLE